MATKGKARRTHDGGEEETGPKRHPFPTQEDIDSGMGQYYRAGSHTICERKYFRKGKLYIIDDKNIDDFDSGPRNRWCQKAVPSHVAKCSAVAACFKDVSPYEVCGVPPHPTEEQWNAYWNGEMSKWRPGELIIVYYHGNAGGNGDHYYW